MPSTLGIEAARSLASMAGDARACQSCEGEMDTSIKEKPMADLRDYLAEERISRLDSHGHRVDGIRICGGSLRLFVNVPT
jgi:hypothetical protein